MPNGYQPFDFGDFFSSGQTGEEGDPSVADLAKYGPQFPAWELPYIEEEYGYAGEEYGLAGELWGMAQERSLFEEAQRGERRAGAEKRLGLQLRGMGQQMGGTLAQAQESAYDIFGQGEQVAAGGLGARKGLTRRSMKAIEGSTGRGLAGQAMGGLEAKSQYKGTLADLASSAFGAEQALEQAGIGYEAAGIDYARAGMKKERATEQLGRDWEEDMWEYMLMLGQEFGYWWEGEGGGDSGGNDFGGYGGGCFLANTMIKVGDGSLIPIKDIKKGMQVFTYDHRSKKIKRSKVGRTFFHPKQDKYLIVNDTLLVTPNHRVLSNDKWIDIGSLKVGDTLTDKEQNPVKIKKVETVDKKVDVYNFEVDKYHTYIAEDLIVHNKKEEGPGG